jgi:predicted enzyme related to lactoylglutathione lyase
MLESTSWVGVRTDRFEPMVAFVQEALGIPAFERQPGFIAHGMPGGEVFEVMGPADTDHLHFTTGPVPGFRVRDLDAAAALVREAGGELIGQACSLDTGDGWQHFRAPDGFVYEIVTGSFPSHQPSGNGVQAHGFPWIGTATEAFEDMCAFVARMTGNDPMMEEPGMKGYRLGNGAVIEVFGPGHHDHEFYGAEARGPVVAFQVGELERDWDRLVEAGAERVGEVAGIGEWGWAHIRLPDGNLYEILAPRPA